ncbi:unnamed protein product [Adineta steineri]|uniref:CCDC81 HU domain-containing protein n=1 Tax=Adineta steineri TaxID=433720 RepID=A0A818X6X6_9BILA|nr:unnamed protein product [Adineta steineri]CAF3734736.1 unnamed protein product [Adineta steineri]
MIDNINKLSSNLDATKQQQQQHTSASLANLTDDDVVKIWDGVSAFIESFMKQSKGVVIPGFGTFTFIHKRIDVGNNKYLLIQRPIFSFSEKFTQTHALKFTHYPVSGSIPVHPLNYFYIQMQSTYTRDQIEQCVKHVLQVFNRSVAAQRNIEFTFSRIGKLQIRDGKVKMRFFKDFVNAVDGSGGKHLIDNGCNRPRTCDSVMTEREASRPATASNVVLPRLNSRIGNPSMQAIHEENHTDNEQLAPEAKQIKRTQQRDPPRKLPPLIETSIEPAISTTVQPSLNVVTTTRVVNPQDEFNTIAPLISPSDLGQSSSTSLTTKKPSTPAGSMKRAASFYQNEQDNEQTTNNQSIGTVIRATNENTAALGFTRPSTDRSVRDRISSSLNVYSQHINSTTIAKPITPCGHHGAGQELCYLCHQRSKRNVPVYLNEERRIRDAEETKLLEIYRDKCDLEAQRKQDAIIQANREDKQRNAAYNLGIAEAMRARKMERPKTTDVARSFVFRKRVPTPPAYVRQQDLAKQLDAQIKWKQDEDRAERHDKNLSERFEQMQLAEALAQERESFLRNKRLNQEELKNTLDNQVRHKPSGIPAVEEAAPFFGVQDMSTEQVQERRAHAIEIFREQKEIVEQRQRQQLLKQMREQEFESRALDAAKDDLLSDRRERFRRAFTIRKDLESNWTNAMDEKRVRDQDERTHVYAPQGVLVHEQCDQYKRCAQCQRQPNNYGTSNIWRDTRYVPGTRIMV